MLKNTKFLNVVVQLNRDLEEITEPLDYGSVHFECEGREYSLDVYNSYPDQDAVTLTLIEDREVFENCNYQLNDSDFHNPNLTAEVYINSEEEDEVIESVTLFIQQGFTTKAVDLNFLT
mgnify:CR=1 FL=1|tara:strand:- start:9957 stop:10313 length:357 start_codon:yes stop_codon:yes gene_type:complete